MNEFDFKQCLAFSYGVTQETHPETIKSLIPGCIMVDQSEINDDLSGIDFWATLRGGAKLRIDIKARSGGCSNYWISNIPELALEKWSCIPQDGSPGKTGWTLDESKLTDYTLHVFDQIDTLEVFLLPFQLLRIAFRHNIKSWSNKYRSAKQNNGSWISECIFVPAPVVIQAISSEMHPYS